jgi:hypothetical protein
MTIRTLKYNFNYGAALNVDNGTQAYIAQAKYNISNKVDFSYQNTFDLLAGVETNITIPGLQSLQLITWQSIDAVSIALELDTQLTPQPIYNSPTLYGALKFSEVAPLFAPTFIKVKSLVTTSVEIVVIGNR